MSTIDYNSDWRKVASTIYKKPTDSKIYAIVELGVTDLEKYVAKKRKEGTKTILTYLITQIIGRAITPIKAFPKGIPSSQAFSNTFKYQIMF